MRTLAAYVALMLLLGILLALLASHVMQKTATRHVMCQIADRDARLHLLPCTIQDTYLAEVTL